MSNPTSGPFTENHGTTALDGTRYVFAGTTPGQLLETLPPGGNVVQSQFNGNGLLESTVTTMSSGGAVQTAQYTHDPNTGAVTEIVTSSQASPAAPVVPISKVQYTYYVNPYKGGNTGDLRSVNVYEYSGSTWVLNPADSEDYATTSRVRPTASPMP